MKLGSGEAAEGGEGEGGKKDAEEVRDGVFEGGAGGTPESDMVASFFGGSGGEGDEGTEGDAPAAEERVRSAIAEGGEEDGDEEAEEDVVELVTCEPFVFSKTLHSKPLKLKEMRLIGNQQGS
eukprot:TRINITY_DN4900_c0_g1_i1.p1 TRINITY_DN4900_c0_g1~~TRINITY_DN4900_c0_g1_i1.p1  ORF type:complete len:123 (+),score=36.22 TRINITY_DN4900_c0_g1_i1:151-519(+)